MLLMMQSTDTGSWIENCGVAVSLSLLRDLLLREVRVLRLVLGDAPQEVGVLPRADQVREALVVRDDDELEVLLLLARVHDRAQRLRQRPAVLCGHV